MNHRLPQIFAPRLRPKSPQNCQNSPAFLQWFYNFPIRKKQLTGLFTSEVISVVGLVGVGAGLIVFGGRSMLLKQAQSELAVTEINYNIKLDQMGFGFRGQSDNAAIIAAARTAAHRPLDEALRQQVQQILQNEIQARQIEYATLVGRDLRIVVNANADRAGVTFNPNNLVREVMENPHPIKSSEIVSWAELAQENPPLSPTVQGQDALIRYTVTPVRDPQTQQVLGALVSGDIANGKLPIVHQTLQALGSGYSAIYLSQPTGEFTLATSAYRSESDSLPTSGDDTSHFKTPLLNSALLTQAVEAEGKPVTGRLAVDGQTYTVAAKSLPNFAGKPVAVLVRGIPETALNALLKNSLLLQLVVSVLALAVDVGLAVILGRAIAKPIKRLQQTTRDFSDGNLHARAPVMATDEVGQLATTFNQMADRIVSAWHVEAVAQEQVRLNTQLQQEIADRKQTEAALQASQALLREKNQVLKQTLHELQQTQTQMVHAEKMSSLGQMVAGVAHEINNPANFIFGNLSHAKDYTEDLLRLVQLYRTEYPHPTPAIEEEIEAIELDFLCQDFPKLLTSINVGTDRIRAIVKSLQNFSRLDEAEVKSVEIHDGIESTLLILKNRLKSKPNRPQIDILKEYGSLPLVDCYPSQLNQVFMNLLANAIDALEEKMGDKRLKKGENLSIANPQIRIRTQQLNPDWVGIYIADNGPGMPEKVRWKLFDPFFTTKPVGKGTGLGLSISYQIVVQKHGGYIRCNSQPEKGTEFAIELPIHQDAMEPTGIAPTPIEANGNSAAIVV